MLHFITLIGGSNSEYCLAKYVPCISSCDVFSGCGFVLLAVDDNLVSGGVSDFLPSFNSSSNDDIFLIERQAGT